MERWRTLAAPVRTIGDLRVLVTNITLTGRTGTEVVVRDLAWALKDLGVDVSVYTPAPGVMADEIRARGVPVTDNLATLEPPDVVHGHHHVEAVEALLHFPRARGVFVGHDATAWHDRPPQMLRLLRYVAVDRRVGERLLRYPFVQQRGLTLIPNAVDTARHRLRGPLPSRPARALVFSNYLAEGADLEMLRAACARLDIALDTAGSRMQTQAAAPETVLPQYDIVFGKARCAVEAAATGCFVVLYHNGMLGPELNGENIAECLSWNLGQGLLTEPLTPKALETRLKSYSARTAEAVSAAVRKTNALDAVARRWLSLYQGMMAEPLPQPSADERREYMTGMARTVAHLEEKHAPAVMPALPATVVEQVGLQVLHAPPAVRCGVTFEMKVRLRNASPYRLVEALPHPVRLGCRWIQGRKEAEAERRGILSHPSEPGSEAEFAFEQVAPRVPGKYTLRVTMVQEHVRWFDSTSRGLALDLPIVVTAD